MTVLVLAVVTISLEVLVAMVEEAVMTMMMMTAHQIATSHNSTLAMAMTTVETVVIMIVKSPADMITAIKSVDVEEAKSLEVRNAIPRARVAPQMSALPAKTNVESRK